MAERRMFAKSIVNSAKFLRMPATARLLYYDLGMAADDDGFVEAFAIIRMTYASEDDLRILAVRGFIEILNEDLVTRICDWKVNNYIKKDRYRPSMYAYLLDPTVSKGNGIQTGTTREERERIGKDRLGKYRLERETNGTSVSSGYEEVEKVFSSVFGRRPKIAFMEKINGYETSDVISIINQGSTQRSKDPETYITAALRGMQIRKECDHARKDELADWEKGWLERLKASQQGG